MPFGVLNAVTPTTSAPVFELSSIDLSPLTSTLLGAAAVIIPAAIGYILIKKGIGIVPAMINKFIKG